MSQPLADRIRPTELDDVVGQQHLLAKGMLLRNIIENNRIPNMIFYGPSGVGKTTVANIIAANTGKKLYKLNATNASVTDIKDIVSDLDSMLTMNGVLLYLDEIQNFNKKQQQSLLEFMENGKITVIASTTENPYFYIYNAVLSRASVFEFKQLDSSDVKIALKRALKLLTKEYDGYTVTAVDDALEHISRVSNGDVRKAINALEMIFLSAAGKADKKVDITLDLAVQATQKKAMRYDKDGDSHYDILSAFQKSIRGSDVNAGLHYLARLLSAGDLLSPCRRLMVIASEDIGMAYPNAVAITRACVENALQLGLPEARLPLAQAVITLATAPKSNSVIMAIDMAMKDIETKDISDIPIHLKDSHYKGAAKLGGRGLEYKYPHSYKNNYIPQQYLPDSIKSAVYYEPGNNKNEQANKKYWDEIKKEKL